MSTEEENTKNEDTAQQKEDKRVAHNNIIRERLMEEKEKFIKQNQIKALGPDTICKYLWEKYQIAPSRTYIQNMFTEKEKCPKIDISTVLALCDWWELDPQKILAFPGHDTILPNKSIKDVSPQTVLTDQTYNGTYHCYFFKIYGTDSSFKKAYPTSLPKKEDLIHGIMKFDINSETGSKATFEYNQLVRKFGEPDEQRPKFCTCTPMVSTKYNNIFMNFYDQDGRFYYMFFDHQIFVSGSLYFRIGGMVTEASQGDNCPMFQKFVLFQLDPDESQHDLIRGLLNINPNNLLISPEQLTSLSEQDPEIKRFYESYKQILEPHKREIYCFNENIITKEPGEMSEYDAKRTLIKLRHFTFSQNQFFIGRDPDAHRVARRMQMSPDPQENEQ
jgi:uncharacterized protein YodC (DUF2158 family)